ncbi:MAG: glycosyltransferase family 2 protein, partial [Gemmatimonadales bacterium]
MPFRTRRRLGVGRLAVWAVLTALQLVLVALLSWATVSLRHHGLEVDLLLMPAAVSLVLFEARWFALPLMRVPVHRAQTRSFRVAMVTTFVPGAEPLDMLAETLRALVAVRGHHDTWVLDEGDSADVRALAESLGVRHFSRRGMPHYQTGPGPFAARTKHGNYTAWLDAVGYDVYDILVNVDPDHVLEPRFLERTLGHLEDDTIAYVQAAQAYYNQAASFIARGAAEETYAYYSSVQMTSFALGYPIVTGCHTVQRMQALREVGGFADHDADDLLITIRYRMSRWRGVYVPEILGRGITPVDWQGYLGQQRRWAASVLDIKFRIYPQIARLLPRRGRVVGLFHGLYYFYGIGMLFSLAVLSVALFSGDAAQGPPSGWMALVTGMGVALCGCEAFRQSVFLDRRERGIFWRAGLLRFAKWPFVLLAFFDAAGGQPAEYQVTRKVPGTTGPAVGGPHLLAGGVVLALWSAAVASGRHPALVFQLAAAAVVALSA